MQKILELKIGRYLVKVGKFPDGFRFSIFSQDKSLFGKGVEATEESAIEAARALISTHNLNQQANRINGIPTAKEFAEALTAIKPSDAHWDMLKAHYNAPGKKLTSTQLATVAGYEHLSVANMQYGVLGHKLSDYLDYEPLGKYKNGDPLWITILVDHAGESFEDDTGHYKHELRKEVAEALEILGAT